MVSIVRKIDVNSNVATAWKKVSDVGGVTELTSLITECKLDGENRYCTMADGSKLTERIISVDPEHKRVVYTITEGPMPLEFHCATMQVNERGSGAQLVWSVDVKPDALEAQLEPMMDMVADSMRAKLS